MSVESIKKLRDETGLGIMECKNALAESKDDYDKAKELAITRSAGRVKPGREIKNGLVEAYIHNGRIGCMIQVNCETDFVSMSPEFKALVRDLAQQIVGTNPSNTEELLKQDFLKNTRKTIGEMLNDYRGKCGENIEIVQFSRYEIGSKFKAL